MFVMLLKQEQDPKLQKLQDFQTILEAIHLLFNLTILETSHEYVYSEVICLQNCYL